MILLFQERWLNGMIKISITRNPACPAVPCEINESEGQCSFHPVGLADRTGVNLVRKLFGFMSKN